MSGDKEKNVDLRGAHGYQFGFSQEQPTLEISRSCLIGNWAFNQAHDVLQFGAEKLGDKAAGPIGEYSSRLVGDVTNDAGQKDNCVDAAVWSNIFKSKTDFLKANSTEERLKIIGQANANIDMVRKLNLDDKYAVDYLKAQMFMVNKLFSDLPQGENVNAEQYAKFQQDLKLVNDAVQQAKDSADLNNAEFKQQLASVRQYVAQQRAEYKNELDQKIQSAKVELSVEQKNALEQFYQKFGVKLDQEAMLRQQQGKVISSQMVNILKKFEIEARDKQTAAIYEGAAGAFGAIAQLGQVFGNKDIARVGIIGQSAVKIAFSIAQLTGSGITAVTGLAALGPMGVMLSAGLAIFSCFQKQPDQLAEISKQIQALHQEMRASFGRVLKNQQLIYDTLVKGLDYMVRGVKQPISSRLIDIWQYLQFMQEYARQERHQINLQEVESLKETIEQISCESQQEMSEAVKQKLKSCQSDLVSWLKNNACLPMYTGALYIGSFRSGDYLKQLNEALENNPPSALIGMLAKLAKSQDPHFPSDINVDKLFNINIWLHVFPTYLKTVELIGDTPYTKKVNDQFESMMNNMMRFMYYLQNTKVIYDQVLQYYHQARQHLQQLTDRRYGELKHENKLLDNLSLSELLGPDEKNYDDVEKSISDALDTIDTLAKLMAAYNAISGLAEVCNGFKLAGKQEFLVKKLDWSDKKHIDASIISEDHACYVNAEINGERAVFKVSVASNQLQLYRYLDQECRWEPLGEKVALSVRPDTKLSMALTQGDLPVVYLMCTSYLSVDCFSFSLTEKVWKKMPTPEFNSRGNAHIKIAMMRIHGEHHLVAINCNHLMASQLHVDNNLEFAYLDQNAALPVWRMGAGYQERAQRIYSGKRSYTADIFKLSTFSVVVSQHGEQDILSVLVNQQVGRKVYRLSGDLQQWQLCRYASQSHDSTLQLAVLDNLDPIQDHLVSIEGRPHILTTAMDAHGLWVYRYDIENDEWHAPNKSANIKWPKNSHYRVTSCLIRGEPYLIALREQGDRTIWGYQVATQTWQALQQAPSWPINIAYQHLFRVQGIPSCGRMSFARFGLMAHRVSENHDEIIFDTVTKEGAAVAQLKCVLPLSTADNTADLVQPAEVLSILSEFKTQLPRSVDQLTLLPLSNSVVCLKRLKTLLQSPRLQLSLLDEKQNNASQPQPEPQLEVEEAFGKGSSGGCVIC